MGGVRLEIANISNFFRELSCKGRKEITQWLKGENGVQGEFLYFFKTEKVI